MGGTATRDGYRPASPERTVERSGNVLSRCKSSPSKAAACQLRGLDVFNEATYHV
jgi:hypothetical protein